MSETGYYQIEAHSYGILKREASPFPKPLGEQDYGIYE